ncbi:hypothetical protein MBLNU230_g7328t1 [Neophaeotheca triangularis]
MNDPGLNQLLQWSVEHSDASRDAQPTDQQRDPAQGLDPQVLAQLLGAPSDADRMKDSMHAIRASDVDVDNKLIAYDNFEQLVEQIDNANNMGALGLWAPLLEQLTAHQEAELRAAAAGCVKTIVQNNVQAQERLLALEGVGKLVTMLVEDEAKVARKRAAGALSSAVRNYQPALDEMRKLLPEDLTTVGNVDAGDMEAVDQVIGRLREFAER